MPHSSRYDKAKWKIEMVLAVGVSLSKLAEKPLVLNHLKPQHHTTGRELTSLGSNSADIVDGSSVGCLVYTATLTPYLMAR